MKLIAPNVSQTRVLKSRPVQAPTDGNLTWLEHNCSSRWCMFVWLFARCNNASPTSSHSRAQAAAGWWSVPSVVLDSSCLLASGGSCCSWWLLMFQQASQSSVDLHNNKQSIASKSKWGDIEVIACLCKMHTLIKTQWCILSVYYFSSGSIKVFCQDWCVRLWCFWFWVFCIKLYIVGPFGAL